MANNEGRTREDLLRELNELKKRVAEADEAEAERRRTEAALEKSQERYQSLFENSPISLWEEDFSEVKKYLDGLRKEGIRDFRGYFDENPDKLIKLANLVKIVDINETTVRIYNARSKEELLSGFAKTFTDESWEVLKEELIAIAAGKTSFESEAVTKTLTGERIHVVLRWAVAPGFQETLSKVLVSMINITERKRIEEQFLQSQKMEAIGRFAAGVSHDLNNLLTAMSAYSELLLDSLGRHDELRGYVEEIRKAVKKAASLTKQLVVFGRKQVLQPKLLDLNRIVQAMEDMLRRMIGEDIELEIRLRPDIGSVRIDEGQIEQIIMNLAVNARDAMKLGGKLTIETTEVKLDETYTNQHVDVEAGPYVMLAVSDTGHGMEEEVKSHIFEPFFTTKERDKGTGLGLSTVFGIVKQCNGHIWVYSEPEKGTTFKIYLPRVLAAPESTEHEKTVLKMLGGSETVLLVEDDEHVRRAIREILQKNGYKILEARDPGEALLASEQHTGLIHLMLTDVVMPRMSGPELAERLRPWHPEMKVLYVSGYADNAIVHHGILDRGTAFLQKPFTLDEILEKVRQVLDTFPNLDT